MTAPASGPTCFWQELPAALIERLDTTSHGLSSAEARRRLARDGPNRLAPARRRGAAADMVHRLGNPLVAILVAAAVVAGATGDIPSFVIIVAVVLVSTILDVVQERRAEGMAAALKQSIALRTAVLRDDVVVDLPVDQLVMGDIVQLCAGDLVPADGVVLAVNCAQLNQALLTGEPYPAAKRAEPLLTASQPADAPNALFQGTSMVAGTATMLVVATGASTRFGAIAASLSEAQRPTAFERGIHRLGLLIARLTVFLVLFVLLAHLALGRPPLQSFLFAMALAVGLTPELLPMIMTVALARGAQRMARAKVIVKRLSAIHDLGEMDILCTDKTGTLTEARITLVAHPGIDGADDDRVLELAAVNARFESGLKSPLDTAVLAHTANRALDTWRKLDERPFDFERRRVSVLAEREGERLEIVKGAPETLLGLCDSVCDRNGERIALDDAVRARLRALQDDRSAQGLRLLAVAWKPAPGRERIGEDDDGGLVFAGYCVFVDPPKAGASVAVARLEAAGVRIKVLTGDAAAVASHLMASLALPVGGVLSGEEVALLDDAALSARVEQVDLFARVAPDQKTRIVKALQLRGHVVGFIGDGINDAPAIRAADVGLSVDGAADVAREAADMILLDTDLGVVADGVAEGRRTYANILKYIRMGTSSNFGNMLTMALASLVLPFLPLTAVQILLNNLIYDLSQIGIPFDGADPRDLGQPRGFDMKALVRFTAVMGPLSSLFDILTFVLLLALFHVDTAAFRTAWFAESMATQILVVFIIRTSRPAWLDRPHRALVLTSVAGLIMTLALTLGPVAALLGFGQLSLAGWGSVAGLVIAYLASAELLKRFASQTLPVPAGQTGQPPTKRRPWQGEGRPHVAPIT